MATSAGLQCEVDPVLCQALRVHKGECLIKLVVFIQLISPEGPYIKPKRSDCETHKSTSAVQSTRNPFRLAIRLWNFLLDQVVIITALF